MANAELRDGYHVNKNLTINTYSTNDEYTYWDHNSAENSIKKYFPKPLDFFSTNTWINRIFYSEIKINNETQDNWSTYLANSFYDVEGNYGAINCLISLNNQMHFMQDRGVGQLMINPVAMINGGVGTSIKLGTGKTIERHLYKALDIGTKHQWSVYRSSNQILFVDVRHKKLYSYTGDGVNPISDMYGQRGFLTKRLHDGVLINDNPIINKGILTTYDYFNNEFLITFLNGYSTGFYGAQSIPSDNLTITTTNESYTLAFSEPMSKFTSYYSFKPNIYINNNRYLFSNINRVNNIIDPIKNNTYLHNYGSYGQFYNLPIEPSTIKIVINDNPIKTKIFDNLTFLTESVKDNLEYSNDYNIYPGAANNPNYPDNVNNQLDTFDKVRFYNDWQNTDFTTLTTITPNNNLTRKERDFNLQIPRNKFDYNINTHSTNSLFEPGKLTRTTFGERMRDKYIIVDLVYSNLINNRFIASLLKTIYRISDR